MQGGLSKAPCTRHVITLNSMLDDAEQIKIFFSRRLISLIHTLLEVTWESVRKKSTQTPL